MSDDQLTDAEPAAPFGTNTPGSAPRRTTSPILPISPRMPTAPGAQQQGSTPSPTTPAQPTSGNAMSPNGATPAAATPSSPTPPTPPAATSPAGGTPAGGAPAGGADDGHDHGGSEDASSPADGGASDQAAKPPINPGEAAKLATDMAGPMLQAGLGLPTALMGLGSGLLAPFGQILNQFGQGNPAMPSSSGLPPGVLDRLDSTDASTGMTGGVADAYQSEVDGQARQAHALDNLEKKLRTTLESSASNTTMGRDKIQQIISQVRSSLQAMGPIANTPMGQMGVLSTITQALQQASGVLLEAVGKDGLNAQGVKEMSLDYLKDLNAGGQGAELAGNFGPTGRLTANSSPREVFAAVLAEAKRRGYPLEKALAIASTMWQESKGRVNAQDPSGQWYGPFQQDTSYAGRRDPNLNISAFFDRLDAKGGRTAPDIWKTIFWLQQAPGMGSADAAYAGGRHAYLSEIQSQLPTVTQMYREMSGTGHG
ncbi:hypothetical protein MycrhDRAFT_5696 [Mycolicibacterium rhodesiae JS60]|nr:hypothetical protein MycrhDRAFT_5696 [Mycolicibacterium rhodesiae JS60]